MKRGFFVYLGLGLLVSVSSQEGELVPLYSDPTFDFRHEQELGGTPYRCDSPLLSKLQQTYPERSYSCNTLSRSTDPSKSLHVLVIRGKINGVEGYMKPVDYDKFQAQRAAAIQNLPAKPVIDPIPNIPELSKAVPEEVAPQVIKPKYPIPAESVVKTAPYAPNNSKPWISPPTVLPDVVAAPPTTCETCGRQLVSGIDKAHASADEAEGKIAKEDDFSPACPAFSVPLGKTSSIELMPVATRAGDPYHELSPDGSTPIIGKNVKNGYPRELCRAKLIGGCGTKEDLDSSPQRQIADATFAKSDGLFDKYENCLQDKSRNCESLHTEAVRVGNQAVPLCRAATEAFYSLCDPGRLKTPEERRNDIDRSIDSHFAKFGRTALGPDVSKQFDVNILKCIAEREDPAYQAYRMNLSICKPFPTSTAVGLFQVTNILVAELLRTNHCSDLNKFGVPCESGKTYYVNAGVNPKTGKPIMNLKRDLLMQDAQTLQDKMSTNTDLQISIALVAMGLTMGRNKNDVARSVEAWKTGADQGLYRKAVLSCSACLDKHEGSCFGKAHLYQK